MGSAHASSCAESPLTELVGLCDEIPAARERIVAAHPSVPIFETLEGALDATGAEAVIIATPHWTHPELAATAFRRGVHVLSEKPIAVHAAAARRMIADWERERATSPALIFAAMFQQRTNDSWRTVKAMIDRGDLGRLVRTTWIITDWFRTQHYYDSGSWRATWRGEGGGVLLNQCPHNLDLYRWFVGMPKRVHGHCSIGKYHDIEVEDEVTAYFEHENGMVGHFITSTGESPGTNRLEIVGEKGSLLWDGAALSFRRNEGSMLDFIKSSKESFAKVPHAVEQLSCQATGNDGHRRVIENFARAIRQGEPLIAPGAEGLESVLLGNAILFSSLSGAAVEIPMDEGAYERKLEALAASSRYQKKEAPTSGASDLRGSF